MGSAKFAVPSLEKLALSSHEIPLVVTQPDSPAGRGMHVLGCPLAQRAKGLGLELFQPKSVKTPEAIERLKIPKPDIIVVVAYGKILPKELLAIPRHGSVNLHASLLPKYRGAAPINWAIANGEIETGVTTQKISSELDAGDVLMSQKTQIGPKENAAELYERLSETGAELLLRTIALIESGGVNPKSQDPSQVSFAPLLRKEDGLIDWNMSSCEIFNRVRGFVPWPGAYTKLGGRIFRIHKAEYGKEDVSAPPGTVTKIGPELSVACGKGILYPTEVQIEGKRRMAVEEFLRGHKIQVGTILG